MKRKSCVLIICALLSMCMILCGCEAQETAYTDAATNPEIVTPTDEIQSFRWFDLSVTPLSKEDLPWKNQILTVPGTDRSLEISGFSAADIFVDGAYIPLEQAVESGKITPEQVASFVRLDAAEGNCREEYVTHLGLTRFYYYYPEYAVQIVCDVKVFPDGTERLINGVAIESLEMVNTDPLSYMYMDENGNRLDVEDWGIRFETDNVSATGMTIRCTQSGGQHAGQLVITTFMTFSSQAGGPVDLKIASFQNWFAEHCATLAIENDGVTELVIDWGSLYGSLPSGEYRMLVTVTDVYDPEDIHPFMVNFRDNQDYTISFIVP